MATLDDGVVNLQRFVASLALSTEAVGTTAQHLAESEGRLAGLAGEVRDEGGGLNDDLEQLGTALDTAHNDARDALAAATQAATHGQAQAGEAHDAVQGAAGRLEGTIHEVVSDLGEVKAQLAEQGFEPLAHTLAESEQELATGSHEGEEALTELEAAVQAFETAAQAAWDAADTDVEEALSNISAEEPVLTSEAEGGVHDFESAAADLEQACTALEEEVETIYEALAAGVEAQGHEWDQTAQREAQQAIGFVSGATQQRLEQPAGQVEDEALAALTQEYAALGAALDLTAATATTLEPLAEDLAKSHIVVGQIDELMNALAG